VGFGAPSDCCVVLGRTTPGPVGQPAEQMALAGHEGHRDGRGGGDAHRYGYSVRFFA